MDDSITVVASDNNDLMFCLTIVLECFYFYFISL